MLGRFSLIQIARAVWNNSFVALADRTVTVGGGNVAAVRNVVAMPGASMTWDGGPHDIVIGTNLTNINKAIVLLAGTGVPDGTDAFRAIAIQNANTVRFTTEALPGSPTSTFTFYVIEFY